MNNTNLSTNEIKPHMHSQITPKTYEGLYHSSSINKSPAEVYALCQRESTLKKVLSDLPEEIKNFLNLEFVSAIQVGLDTYEVHWKNKKNVEPHGTLSFIISPAPAGRGTVLIANGIFGNFSMNDEEPSDLINVFLKRVKALCETGQIATITGQPNGKDEDENENEPDSTLKH